MREKIKQVYHRMSDELSREVFEARLLSSLTGRYKFVNQLAHYGIRESLPIIDAIREKYACVIYYGAGQVGADMYYRLGAGFCIAFCDSDKTKHGTDFVGRKVLSPEELCEAHRDKDCLVFISVANQRGENEIYDFLISHGFPKNQIMRYSAFQYDADGVQYFPRSILPRPHRGMGGGVFVDAGCYDFSTSYDFISWCGGYEKIIAFEPNPAQYPVCEAHAKCISNATVYPYALWNENTEMEFKSDGPQDSGRIEARAGGAIRVKAVKLDDVLCGEKVSFVKMDIEGAELNALEGAEKTILKCRPKLAISVYHKPEDIWEIPTYILSLHDGYQLWLRHYSSGHDDTVLYAI